MAMSIQGVSHRISFDGNDHPHAQRIRSVYGGSEPIFVQFPAGARVWRVDRHDGHEVLRQERLDDGVLIIAGKGANEFVLQRHSCATKFRVHLTVTWQTGQPHGLSVRDRKVYVSPEKIQSGPELRDPKKGTPPAGTAEAPAQPDEPEEVTMMKQRPSRRRRCKSGVNNAPWYNKYQEMSPQERRRHAFHRYMLRRISGWRKEHKERIGGAPKWWRENDWPVMRSAMREVSARVAEQMV